MVYNNSRNLYGALMRICIDSQLTRKKQWKHQLFQLRKLIFFIVLFECAMIAFSFVTVFALKGSPIPYICFGVGIGLLFGVLLLVVYKTSVRNDITQQVVLTDESLSVTVENNELACRTDFPYDKLYRIAIDRNTLYLYFSKMEWVAVEKSAIPQEEYELLVHIIKEACLQSKRKI